MLAGRRAFDGEDVSDTLAGILRGEPDWTALPATAPAAIRKVLRRCLEKDRTRRLRDIGGVSILIEDLADSQPTAAGTTQPVVAIRGRRRERVAWAALVLALTAAAIALAIPVLRRVPADTPAIRFSVSPPPNVTLSLGNGQVASVISPDGRRIAFVAARAGELNRLWIRSIDSLDAQPLPGTETATQPFWSPDSRSLGFFAGGKLKTIDASGGPVQSLCDALNARGGTWSRNGVIVFGSLGGGLFKVAASGGQPTPLTMPDASRGEGAYRFPSFLPDGRRFVYLAAPSNTIWLGSLDAKETRRLLSAESQAQHVAPGYLLFARQGTLLAQPFDARRTAATGDPMPIAEQVASDPSGSVAFSVSENGTLAYRIGAAGLSTQTTWFDPAGKPIGPVGSPGPYRNPDLSPDGTRVAMEAADAQSRTQDIWLLGLARGVVSRLTFDPRNDTYPVWSPDGNRIAFGSDREGGFNLYEKLSNGAAGEELLLKSSVDATVAPFSWS
jgi:Tol biopolymer transport system component